MSFIRSLSLRFDRYMRLRTAKRNNARVCKWFNNNIEALDSIKMLDSYTVSLTSSGPSGSLTTAVSEDLYGFRLIPKAEGIMVDWGDWSQPTCIERNCVITLTNTDSRNVNTRIKVEKGIASFMRNDRKME